MPDITDVDFQELGTTIPPFLQAVSADVNEKVRLAAHAAHRAAHPREHGVECSLGSMQIPEVQQWSRHLTGTFEAVDANACDVIECVEKTVRAVQAIAERYRTVEQRNATNAADIASMLPH